MNVTVFPNFAAKRRNGFIWLESSHSLLLDALSEAIGGVSLATIVDVSSAEDSYSALRNSAITFLTLGEIGSRSTRSRKVLDYLLVQKPIFDAVRASDFCYIYLPGHVGLLACMYCMVLRKSFGIYLRGELDRVTPTVLRWLPIAAVRRAQFVFCTGEGLTRQMAKLNPESIAVVPMSDVLLTDIEPKKAYAIHGRCKILFVGELVRDKGTFELVRAIAELKKNGMDAEASLVGTGREKEALHSLAKELGVEQRLNFVGFVGKASDLARLYLSHDVFCLPTYSEGFPRVLYEAMAFALPIVTTPVGQITTVLTDGASAILARPRDVVSLATGLARVASDEELRRSLATAAHQLISARAAKWRRSTHGHQVAYRLGVANVRA